MLASDILQRAADRLRKPGAWKVGDIVLYSPSPGRAFGAVVDSEPTLLGGHTWVVWLKGLGREYALYTGRNRTTVPAAACDCMQPAPLDYVGGEWLVNSEVEQQALVTFASESSPETGHVGWLWWANGDMGESPSYEQARLDAVAALESAAALARQEESK